MEEYEVEIGPQSNLNDITNMVQGEEAGASRFKRSTITFYQGRITNLVVFEILDPGDIPPKPHFLDPDAPAPDNHSLDWEGVMIVSGTSAVVRAYREPADD